MVQISTVREALTGKKKSEQGPEEVGKTEKTPRDSLVQKTGQCKGLEAGAALDSQQSSLAQGKGHLQTKSLVQGNPSGHLKPQRQEPEKWGCL